MSEISEAALVESWNATYPVGQAVRYSAGFREGATSRGRTRSRATLLGGHTAVVWVEGYSGCIALSHVQAVTSEVDRPKAAEAGQLSGTTGEGPTDA